MTHCPKCGAPFRIRGFHPEAGEYVEFTCHTWRYTTGEIEQSWPCHGAEQRRRGHLEALREVSATRWFASLGEPYKAWLGRVGDRLTRKRRSG